MLSSTLRTHVILIGNKLSVFTLRKTKIAGSFSPFFHYKFFFIFCLLSAYVVATTPIFLCKTMFFSFLSIKETCTQHHILFLFILPYFCFNIISDRRWSQRYHKGKKRANIFIFYLHYFQHLRQTKFLDNSGYFKYYDLLIIIQYRVM